METVIKKWLVWSNEHNSWWSPNRCGYTKKRSLAGRYTVSEAIDICTGTQTSLGRIPADTATPDETMLPDV